MTATLEHFYESIPGYFTFPVFYRWVALNLPTVVSRADSWRGHFVEVGVHAGRSAAFLAVELARQHAYWQDRGRFVPYRLDLVDHFHGGVEAIRRTMAPVGDIIGEIHQGESADVAAHYEDRSLDFVFIDADHAYESVKRDIAAWEPKIRSGGILAGHDFGAEFPGVIQAVIEAFEHFEVRRESRWPDASGTYFPVWMVRR